MCAAFGVISIQDNQYFGVWKFNTSILLKIQFCPALESFGKKRNKKKKLFLHLSDCILHLLKSWNSYEYKIKLFFFTCWFHHIKKSIFYNPIYMVSLPSTSIPQNIRNFAKIIANLKGFRFSKSSNWNIELSVIIVQKYEILG